VIYTKDFVWLHFPKCAGTKVEVLFRRHFRKKSGLRGFFSRRHPVHQDPVGIRNDPSIAWHDSIAEREARDPEFRLGDRVVICPVRRLPAWLESRYNFGAMRNPQLPHNPEMLLQARFLEADGSENHAENYVKRYLPEEIVRSGRIRFLRTEFFESDFKSIFGEFLDISTIPDREFQEKVNTSKRAFPESLRERLYCEPEQVYSSCPYWRSVEEIAYSSQAPSLF
jgi:hypothetical protein